MAVTLKQLEAFYWTATLGGFSEASERLNLAQSTISKRILELEEAVGTRLLERSTRSLQLTRAGAGSLPVAAEMLALAVRFKDAAGGLAAFEGPFRFGVTELVALTWLPALVLTMTSQYPKLVPVPEVASSGELFAKLRASEIDLAIGLDPPAGSDLVSVPLDSVRLEWMCAPSFGPSEDVMELRQLAEYPILTQSRGSGLQRLVLDWAGANGLQANRTVECNSLNVLAGLAASGLGITFLTADYFEPEIAAGRLRIISTDPPLPAIQYFAVHRAQDYSLLPGRIAALAQTCCDFRERSLSSR
jgi:DNA-binding transcriptional LysR family regulator